MRHASHVNYYQDWHKISSIQRFKDSKRKKKEKGKNYEDI